jgi:hypothetical protein
MRIRLDEARFFFPPRERVSGRLVTMGVKTSVALVSAWLLLHSQPAAAADGIGGWPLLHWGMTKQQVERAYPNFEYYDHIFAFTGSKKVLGLHEYSAAGCNFEVWLSFYDNKLFEIQLESIIRKGSFDDQLCKAKDALLKAYGQPEVSNPIPDWSFYTWITDDTQVTYAVGPLGNDFREEGVSYTKRDWWSTPHQKKRL